MRGKSEKAISLEEQGLTPRTSCSFRFSPSRARSKSRKPMFLKRERYLLAILINNDRGQLKKLGFFYSRVLLSGG
jgi:hypothetical protein